MPTEKEQLIKQIPYRIHLHEKTLLYQLLENEGIKFQQLIDAFVEAYMRGDKQALHIVKTWKDMNIVPEELKDRYMLSQRERSDILSEIEKEEKEP